MLCDWFRDTRHIFSTNQCKTKTNRRVVVCVFPRSRLITEFPAVTVERQAECYILVPILGWLPQITTPCSQVLKGRSISCLPRFRGSTNDRHCCKGTLRNTFSPPHLFLVLTVNFWKTGKVTIIRQNLFENVL